LIHPSLVVYAAHCGGGQKTLRFNTQNNNNGFTRIGTCTTNPDYGGVVAKDWAFCVLDSPVNMPITPAMHGCEMQQLQVGDQVAIVGFGQSHNGGAGTKRWAMTELTGLNLAGNASRVGSSNLDPTICPGDSGGPAFRQFPDGSWHAFGIASILLGTCGQVGDHSLITGAIPWIETTSGLDVTPCFDADGTWNAGPGCGGFSTAGLMGYGNWNNECSGQPSSGPSQSCGPANDATPETDPPTVTIVTPLDEESFASGTPIDFEITADDGAGWGITRVTLEIDGQIQGDLDPKGWDLLAPWGFFMTNFNDGVYEIRAVAEDGWQNRGFSAPITIYVGDDGGTGGTGDDGEDTTDDGGDTTTDGGGDTTTDDGTDDDSADGGTVGETSDPTEVPGSDEGGCDCRAASASARPRAGLAVLALLVCGRLSRGRRRRRS